MGSRDNSQQNLTTRSAGIGTLRNSLGGVDETATGTTRYFACNHKGCMLGKSGPEETVTVTTVKGEDKKSEELAAQTQKPQEPPAKESAEDEQEAAVAEYLADADQEQKVESEPETEAKKP